MFFCFSYANTHSENNACASQTTKFREGSRAIIKEYVNATDDDVLIFVGSGKSITFSVKYEIHFFHYFRINRSD
jgi:selenocysteine lyase/cysteine desulfurase